MKALPMEAMTNEKIWQLHSSDVCCARSFLLQEGCDTPIISHVWKFGIRNQRKPTYEVYLLNTEKMPSSSDNSGRRLMKHSSFHIHNPLQRSQCHPESQSHLKPSFRSFGKFFSVFIFQPLTTTSPVPNDLIPNSRYQ